MTKSIIALLITFTQFLSLDIRQAEAIDDLAVLFKAGNAKEIAKNFASSLELIVIDQEDVYSKAQAEQILRDFFVKNLPSKAVILHRSTNNNVNYRFGIINLTTKNGKFRVTITLKKTNNILLITELRIENDKE